MKKIAAFLFFLTPTCFATVFPLLTVDLTNYWSPNTVVTFTAGGWNNSTAASNVFEVILDGNFLFTSAPTAGRSNAWTMQGTLRFDGTNMTSWIQYFSGDTNDPFDLQSATVSNAVVGTNVVVFGLPGTSDTNMVLTTVNFATTAHLPAQSSSLLVNPNMLGVPSSILFTTNGVFEYNLQTITNSTDSTFGYGAGLMLWDTNYVYVSVGTNLWKRTALTAW